MGLVVVAAVAACGEALPLDGSLEDWLLAASGERRAPPAVAGDAATPLPDTDAETLPPDVGASPSCADVFEPNDEPDLATDIDDWQPFEAVLCTGADIDHYRLAAPAGTRFLVRVRFDSGLGDIDILLIDADGVVVAESASVTDEEVVTTLSDGGPYVLQVALFDAGAPAGSPYTVELVVVADTENDCCTESGAPGCSDAGVRECVCATDPYCCTSSYDAYCVQLATSECGSQCLGPANPGSCCAESSASGCGDATIEACVCDLAPFCCSGPFDDACVSIASGLCGGECEEVVP